MLHNKILNNSCNFLNPNCIKDLAFKHRKSLLIAVAVMFVALILLGLFAINQKSRQQKYSAMLHQSMVEQQMGDLQKAKSILQKIHESSTAPTGIKSMASIRYAAFLLEESNKSEALKVYLDLNQCSSCDEFIRDLAGLLAVRTITSDEKELAKAENMAVIQKIEQKATIFKYQIAEQRALIELLKGNLENSYQIFEMIAKSSEASHNLKGRANDGMQMLIEKGYAPKKAIDQNANAAKPSNQQGEKK